MAKFSGVGAGLAGLTNVLAHDTKLANAARRGMAVAFPVDLSEMDRLGTRNGVCGDIAFACAAFVELNRPAFWANLFSAPAYCICCPSVRARRGGVATSSSAYIATAFLLVRGVTGVTETHPSEDLSNEPLSRLVLPTFEPACALVLCLLRGCISDAISDNNLSSCRRREVRETQPADRLWLPRQARLVP